jgi:mitochondrial intermembrane space import and assembly protein 40
MAELSGRLDEQTTLQADSSTNTAVNEQSTSKSQSACSSSETAVLRQTDGATVAEGTPDEKTTPKSAEVNEGAKREEKEEDDEEEGCAFCRFMKGGGCREQFIAWEKCVEAARESDDFPTKCADITEALHLCMMEPEHKPYYQMFLDDQEEYAKEEERKARDEAREREGEAGDDGGEGGEVKEDSASSLDKGESSNLDEAGSGVASGGTNAK